MKSSSISSKGQVTIPQEVRVRLGLEVGDRVEFVMEDDKTILRPVRVRENPFRRYLGAYPAFKSRKEIDDWISEMRDEEPEGK